MISELYSNFSGAEPFTSVTHSRRHSCTEGSHRDWLKAPSDRILAYVTWRLKPPANDPQCSDV